MIAEAEIRRAAAHYDIHQLLQAGVSPASVASLLPAKFAARGMDISALRVGHLSERRAAFEQDWKRRLSYLILGAGAVTFAEAWQSTVEAVRMAENVTGDPSTCSGQAQ